MERLVQILGLLGELVRRTQVEIFAAGRWISTPACLARQAAGGVCTANESSAALRAADEGN